MCLNFISPEIKKALDRAMKKHGKITFCRDDLKNSITEYKGCKYLWYNSSDESTHLERIES